MSVASPLDLATLNVANNDFSFALYKEIGKSDDNIFYSPFSIQLVLFLSSIGAKGQTHEEIINTIRLPKQQSDVLHLYKDLLSEINLHPDYLKMKTGIFVENSCKLRSNFVDSLKNNVESSVEGLDFKHNSSEARDYLNHWVKKHTNGKIKELFPPGSIDASTRLVLGNAIHFIAPWANRFDSHNILDEPFYVTLNKTVPVKMMHTTKHFSYYKDDALHYAALELPYRKKKFKMIVLLPDAKDGLSDLEANLSKISIPALVNNFTTYEVKVSLPKFNIENSVDLKSVLKSMGCSHMFTEHANFSEMSESDDLVASDVLHKAVIDLNENGTEASAATAFIAVLRSGHHMFPEPPKVDFVADHPFIFAITYETNILFLGRVKKF